MSIPLKDLIKDRSLLRKLSEPWTIDSPEEADFSTIDMKIFINPNYTKKSKEIPEIKY